MLTLPLGNGLPASPVTVTKSWTVVPTGTVRTTAWAALWMSVVVVEVSGTTRVDEPVLANWSPSGQLLVPLEQVSCQRSETVSVSRWLALTLKSAPWMV